MKEETPQYLPNLLVHIMNRGARHGAYRGQGMFLRGPWEGCLLSARVLWAAVFQLGAMW